MNSSMRTTIRLVLCSIAVTAFLVPAWSQSAVSKQTAPKFQPLNIKPGLWQNTRTISRNGAMPIPADMLNRLSAEQRARMEERMKAKSGARSTTVTEEHCVTKEDLEKERFKIAEANECTTTIVSSSSTSLKGNTICEMQGMHATGTLELTASDPENVSGSYHSTVTGNGQTMNVNGTWTSKWLGASCGNVK